MSSIMYGIWVVKSVLASSLSGLHTIVDAATYYSTPNDGDTIRLEAHAVVSANPMYESVDVPTRNAYEEVHAFATKAVPSGNADAALYTYVPPTVSFTLHAPFICVVLL